MILRQISEQMAQLKVECDLTPIEILLGPAEYLLVSSEIEQMSKFCEKPQIDTYKPLTDIEFMGLPVKLKCKSGIDFTMSDKVALQIYEFSQRINKKS